MKAFRTVEVSEPAYESDGLRFYTVKTAHLKGRGDVCVYRPEEGGENLPVVVLLHGVYGSAWSWALRGGVHRLAADMIRNKELPPMVLAMPSDGLWGDGSAYLPHDGYDFENWIAVDIPELLCQYCPGVSAASPFFLSGLSMGGFGALRTGALHHTRFKGISAHSSLTHAGQMKLFAEEDISHYVQGVPEEEDLYALLLAGREHLPPFRFDCGREDRLLGENRELHRRLTEAGIPHVYEEFDGGHDWWYWSRQVSHSLRFFASLIRPGT